MSDNTDEIQAEGEPIPPKYTLKLSLNVLKDLGLNLYSNIPSVLSEAVANAWDADAPNVEITIDQPKDLITIVDHGEGMTLDDLNLRYLTVGYDRRAEKRTLTNSGRHVMGRKGIGKLALFSIADEVEVHSVKGSERNGLIMKTKEIMDRIKNSEEYHPEDSSSNSFQITNGTKIFLRGLKTNINYAIIPLRKRLARRFSILAPENNFAIIINGEPLTIADRDFYPKIQFLWTIGEEGKKYSQYCSKKRGEGKHIDGILEDGSKIYCWIGTVGVPSHLKGEEGVPTNNSIVVLAHGKLIEEDLLKTFTEGGIYNSYVIGEINADFLDADEKDDIATSSRQSIKENDDRVVLLRKAVHTFLKQIQSEWSELRNSIAAESTIAEWYNSLSEKHKKLATKLFGKISTAHTDTDKEKITLVKHGILAFERLKLTVSLDEIENLTNADAQQFSGLFHNVDDIEASMFYDIIKQRLEVVTALNQQINSAVLEKVLQKVLFDNIWLLNPEWAWFKDEKWIETKAKDIFNADTASLTAKQREGRIDIFLKAFGDKYIIVELKKADRVVSVHELVRQGKKYESAVRKLLAVHGLPNPNIEVIFVLGKQVSEMADDPVFVNGLLKTINARQLFYQEIVLHAIHEYGEFVKAQESVGRIRKIIDQLES